MSYVQCFEYHCHTYVQLEVPVVIPSLFIYFWRLEVPVGISLSSHLFMKIGGSSRDFPLFCSDIGDWKFQHGFPSPLLCHLGFSTALSDTSRITKLTLQECD